MESLTLGQIISDNEKKATDDVQAQLFARKEVSKRGRRKGSKNGKKYKFSWYTRQKMSKAIKERYKQHPEKWANVGGKNRYNADKKKLSGIPSYAKGKAENTATGSNIALMGMVADRIAKELLSRMT